VRVQHSLADRSTDQLAADILALQQKIAAARQSAGLPALAIEQAGVIDVVPIDPAPATEFVTEQSVLVEP
jgi:hypothetical protein